MAAVVAPVGVDYAQLGHARVALFCIAEIVLAEGEVCKAHGKAHRFMIIAQRRLIPVDKTEDSRDVRRDVRLHIEGFRHRERRGAGFHRIDQVALDFLELLVRDIAPERNDARRRNLRTFALREQLDALRGGIRALVVLPGQVLHRKNAVIRREGIIRAVKVVHIRLGKHRPAGRLKLRGRSGRRRRTD